MKKLLFLSLTLISFGLFSQAPQLINYQGVARNASGTALANTSLQLTITVSGGSYIYTESHTTNSNAVGIFTLHIGGGSQIGANTFAGINWGGGSQSVNVIIDAGSGPQSLGPQQLVSVPYALYANSSGSSSASTYVAGPGIGISSGSVISNTAPQVTITSTPPITVSGSYPFFTIGSSATGTAIGFPATFSINAPNTITTNTLANSHTISIAQPTLLAGGTTTVTNISSLVYLITTPPPTASYSAGVLTLFPGGDTTLIPAGGPWTKTGSNVYLSNTSDLVGIGISAPSAKLQIVSSAGVPNDLSIGSSGTGDALQVVKFSPTGSAATFSVALTCTASPAGVLVANAGAGPGILVTNGSSNSAINATSTGNAPTILAQNTTGSGPSIQGTKILGSVGDAIVGSNSNTNGAAVHAISGSAAGSALALWIDNGHIKSSAIAGIPGVSIATNSLGGFSPSATITPQSTDVKGTVTVIVPSFTGSATGGYIDVNVAFAKNYSIGATVLITGVEPGRFDYRIINQTNTNFVVRIVNNSPSAQNFIPSFPFFRFNYFVIE